MGIPTPFSWEIDKVGIPTPFFGHVYGQDSATGKKGSTGHVYGPDSAKSWLAESQKMFRTKVDEKVDNSGWRIKIVAEVGIPTKLSDKVGTRWSPSFPRQSLARRRARNIVQVHAHALNGSWECYHVVRIGLGAIWGDHGRRRSLHFTTPHFV